MDFFTAMEVSATGLSAQRTRLNVASSNLANVNTTRGPDGGPYRRRDVVLETHKMSENVSGGRAGGEPGKTFGVMVREIANDEKPPRLEYDPGHPDANPDGYVAFPNVNAVEEMVDMITASRAYEAGLTAISSAVQMAERALSIGR